MQGGPGTKARRRRSTSGSRRNRLSAQRIRRVCRRSRPAHKLPARHPIPRPIDDFGGKDAGSYLQLRCRAPPIDQPTNQESARRGDFDASAVAAVIAVLERFAFVVGATLGTCATTGRGRVIGVRCERAQRLQPAVMRRHQPESHDADGNELVAEGTHAAKRARARVKVNSHTARLIGFPDALLESSWSGYRRQRNH